MSEPIPIGVNKQKGSLLMGNKSIIVKYAAILIGISAVIYFLWLPYEACVVKSEFVNGENCYNKKNYRCAIQKFSFVVRNQTRFSAAQYYLGSSYALVGEYEKAEEHLMLAVRYGNHSPFAEKAQNMLRSLE